jgi:hypothetical protein
MTGIYVNALSKMGKNGGTGAKQSTYEVLEKLLPVYRRLL